MSRVWERTGPNWYRVRSCATRNGEPFGAIAKETKCATLEEAMKIGEKKIAEAAKRYAKAVANGEGRQFAKK